MGLLQQTEGNWCYVSEFVRSPIAELVDGIEMSEQEKLLR